MRLLVVRIGDLHILDQKLKGPFSCVGGFAVRSCRLFLFGSRDVWFVVGVPIYLSSQLGWSSSTVGMFFAIL